MGLAERLGPPAADLWELRRRRGFRHAGRELLSLLASKIYVEYDEIVGIKLLVEPSPRAADSELSVETAGADRLPLLDAFNRRHGNRRATRRFESELEGGAEPMLAFVGGELIGYAWWVSGEPAAERALFRRLGIRPRTTDVYAFDVFVAREHRGQGVGTRLMAAQDAELFLLGYRREWIVVDHANEPARRLSAEGPNRVFTRVRSRVFLSRWVVTHGPRPGSRLDELHAAEAARSSSAAPTDSSSAGTC